MTQIPLPELALVALIGASSSGKSTFASRHFGPYEVLSSDQFRALVSGSEHTLDANEAAFSSLYHVAARRLERGLLTVVDATSVRAEDRRRLVELARAHDVLPVAIVLDLPRSVLDARHEARGDRPFSEAVIGRQQTDLRRGLRGLGREGFRHVWTLRSVDDVDAAQITRVPLYSNRRDLRGPFDFIGDVHGCLPELRDLLTDLGYALDGDQVTPRRAARPCSWATWWTGDRTARASCDW
ncbi:AAA family ATPase [Deinococcus caeni]|uniref:AAA family ATPase n=1 Tax=Deinococcus caeni TaxID=569127 RepID=UPI00360DF1A0